MSPEEYLGHGSYMLVDTTQQKDGSWLIRYIDCKTGKWFRMCNGKVL